MSDLELYGDLLRGLEEAVVVVGADGQVLVANHAAHQMLGLDPAAAEVDLAAIHFQWLDNGRFPHDATPLEVVLRSGQSLAGEIVLAHLADGTTRWLSSSARPVAHASGPAVALSWVDVTGPRLMLEALQEINEGYRLLAEYVGDLVARCDDDGHFLYVTPSARDVLGFEADELLGRTPAEVFALVPGDGAFEALNQVLEGHESSARFACVAHHAHGSLVWLEVEVHRYEAMPSAAQDRLTTGVVLVARNVTDRRAMEEALRDAEDLLRSAFENAPVGMIMTPVSNGRVGTVLRCNRACEQIFGRSLAGGKGTELIVLAHPEDQQLLIDSSLDLVEGRREVVEIEIRVLGSAQHYVPVSIRQSVVRGPDGSPRFLVSQFEDISERRENEQKLRDLALHDALTKLPNRRLFEDRLGTALARLVRSDKVLALLYLDLNLFKQVNDRFGHQAGDDLLVTVAGLMQTLVRPSDTVARVGGDEFVVLAEGLHGVADARMLAMRVFEGINVPVGDADPVRVTASIGVAVVSEACDPAGVVNAADSAMFYAKHTLDGPPRVHVVEL
ncbi:MAG: diguanylate cyclase/phosphodiesterase with sensor(s) [Acidimicrobiia bacterium]|nr:diguanylate cyclase/phosphodiesterase with sensor(s) [Acidimicrobiia bacterium]